MPSAVISLHNPFIPSGRDYGAVDTESRLRALEDFDLDQCRAALALPSLQKTVEKKLHSRIRMLEKLAVSVEQSDDQWRELALQFDRHRIQAMALIRAVASGKAGRDECARFAALPPPAMQSTSEMELARFAPVMRGATACMERVAAGGYVRTRDHVLALNAARTVQAVQVPDAARTKAMQLRVFLGKAGLAEQALIAEELMDLLAVALAKEE